MTVRTKGGGERSPALALAKADDMVAMEAKLVGPRGVGRGDIGNLVVKWYGLHHRVSAPFTEKSVEEIKEARARFPEVVEETIDALTRIFDQRSVAAEFEALVPFTGQDQALPEARETLAAAVTERIEWLTKLQNDLDKFPESGRVTMGGRR